MDQLVQEATKHNVKDQELQKQIGDVTISFRPDNYGKGQIAQITGDFTEWIPVNMRMHTIEE